MQKNETLVHTGYNIAPLDYTVSFLSTELPYGWEKIDDPIYGSYYVE